MDNPFTILMCILGCFLAVAILPALFLIIVRYFFSVDVSDDDINSTGGNHND